MNRENLNENKGFYEALYLRKSIKSLKIFLYIGGTLSKNFWKRFGHREEVGKVVREGGVGGVIT